MYTHTHGLGGPRLTAQEADLALGPFVLTEQEATVANPSPAYTDEDMIILSGVEKEHKSNVYGYIRAFDLQVWMVLLCFLAVAAGVAMAAELLVRHQELCTSLSSLAVLHSLEPALHLGFLKQTRQPSRQPQPNPGARAFCPIYRW